MDGIDISNLATSVTNNTSDISTIQTNIGTNSTNISNLQTDLSTHTGSTSNPHQTTLEQARLENNQLSGDIYSSGSIVLDGTVDGVDLSYLNSEFNTHSGSTLNPHQVSLEQSRLINNQLQGNVDFNNYQLQNLTVENLATAPTTPVSGEVYFNTTDSYIYIWDGTIWQNMLPVFGTEFYEIADENESTTTSSNFQQKIRLNADNLTGGKYRLGWYYEWGYEDTRNDYEGRIQINDTTTVMEHREEPQDTGTDQYHTSGGFVNLDLSA